MHSHIIKSARPSYTLLIVLIEIYLSLKLYKKKMYILITIFFTSGYH